MLITVVICTIRRDELVQKLLSNLESQSYRRLEILVVRSPQDADESDSSELRSSLGLRVVEAPPGLAPARNAGLREARGDVVCFLDDDVVIEPAFFEKVIALFSRSEFSRVGGITGYDSRNYPQPVSPRWRLRRLLGITPSLQPGDANDLGRTVPLSFSQPFSGLREVKWLPGFCQIFRKVAIQRLWYDEHAVVEDRDFSMEVARNWRLVYCGDLRLEHHLDAQGRHGHAAQIRRAAFGLGRCFAKRRESWRDWATVAHVHLGEVLIDLLAILRRPSWENIKTPVLRTQGYLAGLQSLARFPATEPPQEQPLVPSHEP